jgi:hypothetical protein
MTVVTVIGSEVEPVAVMDGGATSEVIVVAPLPLPGPVPVGGVGLAVWVDEAVALPEVCDWTGLD